MLGDDSRSCVSLSSAGNVLFRKLLKILIAVVFFFFSSLFKNFIVLSVYSSNFHAVKRESDGAPGDLTSLENERQIYKSVLEGGDIPLQGLSGLKRPSSSASTKGNGV